MFTIAKEDFLEEVKAEMYGYEELTDEDIEEWVSKFEAYLQKDGKKDKKISVTPKGTQIKLEDETELFRIVDKYLSAVDRGEKEAYWTEWSL